jgi:hypothetical protein
MNSFHDHKTRALEFKSQELKEEKAFDKIQE